ncbi:sigma 54-interacting transcriptional regulator [Garciella nitratireducens]|uniref:HTH-type transcriptional regulatory protein TyrR n=1 Tax=Garciella nitratireducens DSM 15102 TaxID=1121911 RepID=A0A1T4NB63_9FIRM|nr:sigma 54-interacting transcriptional regulator [Garciella nitratireducens]SJZ76297.1 transcriptional regulator of aroF, aroG, tyrA and aromatic amino acid transport [Garciella nitratireducens DSM 15102]
MKRVIRLSIKTKDRQGMTLDILRILNNFSVDLRSLEVKPGMIYAKMYDDLYIDLKRLKEKLLEQRDVLEIKEIELLPQEEKEKYMKTVLNATDEGIIAIDKYGKVTIVNQAVQKILKIKEGVGKPISEVIASDFPILDTIKTGKSYDHVEFALKNKNSSCQYMTSGRPIWDEEGKVIGAVATIKDMQSVMDLVYSFTNPSMTTFDEIIGESEKIKKVIEMAKIISKGDSTVMIRGESGTGKELFARSIHMASPRKDRPFVAVNCAALPDSLLESELFGYEEGAFTGAKKGGKQGLFKYADQGTIFLDEIGELSTHLQVKLLRVLQENKIRRVGGVDEIPIDVRVVTATNRNLEKLIEIGQFREDLYYRLNVIPITIPPLRERKEDIPILCEYYIQKLNRKLNKKVEKISSKAIEKLMEYHWPGNIRELVNIIERAINLCDGKIIEKKHIILQEQDHIFLMNTFKEKEKSLLLKEVVAEAEKKAIIKALREHKSIRKAAKALGVSHATVINKMKNYKITNG